MLILPEIILSLTLTVSTQEQMSSCVYGPTSPTPVSATTLCVCIQESRYGYGSHSSTSSVVIATRWTTRAKLAGWLATATPTPGTTTAIMVTRCWRGDNRPAFPHPPNGVRDWAKSKSTSVYYSVPSARRTQAQEVPVDMCAGVCVCMYE